jgi:PhzF family phenazine biosynthesis protein
MRFWQVDAFTDTPFRGNPAAVFILNKGEKLSDALMQNIAIENNLSETVFAEMTPNGNHIRWFTPTSEVDLCGHATIATAHILWEQGLLEDDKVTFDSKSGPISVLRQKDLYQLDFPQQAGEPYHEHRDLIDDLVGAGVEDVYFGQSDLVVCVDEITKLTNFEPDQALIEALPGRGFLLTAADKTGTYDYQYRAFSRKKAFRKILSRAQPIRFLRLIGLKN